MAFQKCSASAPGLTDLRDESATTLGDYGPAVRTPGSYAANCLLARRLLERDVRFVQLYHRGWDQYIAISRELSNQYRDVDKPTDALEKDPRQRGLLDDTLVIFATEFGRSIFRQGKRGDPNSGRDHHGRCFTLWLAGRGVKQRFAHGRTGDFCYNLDEGPVHLHDLHATILNCLGIDHARITYHFRGLDAKLTGVEHARVVKEVLS